MPLSLISSDFADGDTLPRQYTRLGENSSPPLQWSDAPQGTQIFAQVVEDPDAPNGTFRHGAIYVGYDGPQPPAGHGPHHYHFKLVALDVPALEVPKDPNVTDVSEAAAAHTLGQTELVAVFERGAKEM